MTPRPHARTRRAAALIMMTAAGILISAGCDPRTLVYFLQPWEPTVPPPQGAPNLEAKKVVVVTNAVAGTMGEFATLDRDITKKIVSILKEKVKKIEMVDTDKVWNWVEDHPHWTDPEDIAKAFEADVVIFLEIETFQLHNPGDIGVFQGTAKTHIQVTEMVHPKNSRSRPDKKEPKEAKLIYDDYRDTTFPVRGPVQMDSGVSRGAFKSRFLQVVAAEISWHFVEHSPEDDIQDVKFSGR